MQMVIIKQTLYLCRNARIPGRYSCLIHYFGLDGILIKDILRRSLRNIGDVCKVFQTTARERRWTQSTQVLLVRLAVVSDNRVNAASVSWTQLSVMR